MLYIQSLRQHCWYAILSNNKLIASLMKRNTELSILKIIFVTISSPYSTYTPCFHAIHISEVSIILFRSNSMLNLIVPSCCHFWNLGDVCNNISLSPITNNDKLVVSEIFYHLVITMVLKKLCKSVKKESMLMRPYSYTVSVILVAPNLWHRKFFKIMFYNACGIFSA